ncbi:MAG: DUF4340 domain-containing protein [Opitutaceae bacterium]|nr:DUF4340 domain-containing protein [Opitutaceae bacterium]
MKVKSLALAVGALGVVTAAVWFFNRNDNAGPVLDARIGQPLLDSATIAKASQFFLRSGGNEVTLTGVDAAALKAGVVKEYFDMPADWGKFQRLIEDLTKSEAKITRMVGSTPERVGTLGFSGDRIELRDKDGTAFWTLNLGNSPEKGGKFVKFGDETKAYLSGFSGWLDTTAKSWADAVLVPAKADDVVGIEIQFPENGGKLSVNRVDGKGIWKCPDLLDGETLKDSEVSALAGKLAGLRFMDTTNPVALETISGRANARTFKVTLQDGRVFTITASQPPTPPAPPAPEAPADGSTPPPPPPTPAAPPAELWVQSSRADDPINTLMTRRGFNVAEWTFNGLPAKRDALVNPAPPSAPAAPAVPAAEAQAAATP